MELPAALRAAVDAALAGTPVTELRRAADTLSRRYRAELRDGRPHLSEHLAVLAYLAARLPATYAAVRASLASVDELMPSFAPRTLIDVGAGPGTALWASTDCWPSLDSATLVEASAPVRAEGERLAAALPVASRWLAGDAESKLPELPPADLVTLCYVLDELAPRAIAPLIERLWQATAGVLLVVEPGTPAGWRRVLAVRETLIAAGARVVAPCPHQAPCPLDAPDWCHFSRRVARSRVHRLTKEAEVPWEDEKYIFLAASRLPAEPIDARVLAPPRGGGGRVALKLCRADGTEAIAEFSKRDGDTYKKARRLDWGDALPSNIDD